MRGGEDAAGAAALTGALLLRHRRALCMGAAPLAAMCWRACGTDGRFAEGLVLACFLWTAAVLDWRYGLIFDRLTASMAVLALCFHLRAPSDVPALFCGLLAGGAPLFLLRVLTRGGLGGGDVKLMAAGGLWLGARGALLALAIASWTGGLFALALLASGRARRKDEVAFGPFLALGLWAAFLYGERLWRWYEAAVFG